MFKIFPIISQWEFQTDQTKIPLQSFPLPDDALHEIRSEIPINPLHSGNSETVLLQTLNIVAQYPLHHVTYSATKFEVATSNRLGGDTFTRNIEDPDEMQHNAAFHQGLHCLLR